MPRPEDPFHRRTPPLDLPQIIVIAFIVISGAILVGSLLAKALSL